MKSLLIAFVFFFSFLPQFASALDIGFRNESRILKVEITPGKNIEDDQYRYRVCPVGAANNECILLSTCAWKAGDFQGYIDDIKDEKLQEEFQIMLSGSTESSFTSDKFIVEVLKMLKATDKNQKCLTVASLQFPKAAAPKAGDK